MILNLKRRLLQLFRSNSRQCSRHDSLSSKVTNGDRIVPAGVSTSPEIPDPEENDEDWEWVWEDDEVCRTWL